MGICGNITLAVSFFIGILCLILLKFKKTTKLGLKAGIISSAFIIATSFVLLYLLISSDFSVEYVFRNTDRSLPLIYKISAFWSGSAGSLLLWAACNSIVYLFIYGLFHIKKNNNQKYLKCLTATTTILNLGFLIVLIFISNPFKPVSLSSDGFGLNPSLQSSGMVYHPPLIMIAYSCIFATLASILYEIMNPDSPKIRTTRNIALIGWIILTVGIVSGGIWAYSELGWGGYWSWDPIENSALVTWLLATAYLHLFTLKKDDVISSRPLFILIFATAFSVLFGTFLARSGIISSVHAYSNQASKIFFIIILVILTVICMSIFISVFRKREKKGRAQVSLNRIKLYLPSILLILSAVIIMLMTISPLLPLQGLVITEKSYDVVFGLLGLVLLLTSTVFYTFKHTANKVKLLILPISLVFGIIILIIPAFAAYPVFTRIALAVCVFCMIAVLLNFVFNMNQLLSNGSYFTMFVIHLAIIIIAFGLIGTRGMKVETSSVMNKNDTVSIGNHVLELKSVSVDDGSRIKTWTADLSYNNGETDRDIETSLQYYKEKDVYHSKALIISSIKEDLYVIVENSTDDGTILLKVSLLKWVLLLWVGIGMLVAASLFLCWKRLCGNTYYI
jgi:cytochrome c-type biogenesis protein CcmF